LHAGEEGDGKGEGGTEMVETVAAEAQTKASPEGPGGEEKGGGEMVAETVAAEAQTKASQKGPGGEEEGSKGQEGARGGGSRQGARAPLNRRHLCSVCSGGVGVQVVEELFLESFCIEVVLEAEGDVPLEVGRRVGFGGDDPDETCGLDGDEAVNVSGLGCGVGKVGVLGGDEGVETFVVVLGGLLEGVLVIVEKKVRTGRAGLTMEGVWKLTRWLLLRKVVLNRSRWRRG